MKNKDFLFLSVVYCAVYLPSLGLIPEEKAERLMKNAPNSIKCAIKSINSADGTPKGFQEENLQFSRCFGTADFEEGITAFLEKRKPQF